MPTAAPTPCRKPGCRGLAHGGGYCEAHAGEAREQANAIRQANDRRRGNSSQRGYGHKWRTKIRPRILRRDPICRCTNPDCPVHRGRVSCTRPSQHVDHIIPKPEGTDDASNLQGLCDGCHSHKTASKDGGYGRPRKA